MVLNNVYEAAFCKVKGFDVGKVIYNKAEGLAEIEIKGSDKDIKICINDYHMNGQVDAKRFADEVGFIKYLVKQRMK